MDWAVPSKVSVIIPAKNSSKTIGVCLDAVYSNKGVDFEVLVVDDGCTDNTVDIAARYNCRILKNDKHPGVSGARNTGAEAAKGDILLFIDSDIVVPQDMVYRISKKLTGAGACAVVGMLSERIRFDNFASQYKNLWMCYTFNNLSDRLSLVFCSITAIKKSAFLECGGFDINYSYPNVEDNELGISLAGAGHNIILDKTLQVEHLKKYTLLSLLKTHYFRTKGLIKLYNRRKLIRLDGNNPSNVPNSFLFNIPLAIALVFSLMSFFLRGGLFPKTMITIFIAILFAFVNRRWLNFLYGRRGLFFAGRAVFYLPLESLFIVSALTVGEVEYLMGRRY